MRTTGVFPIVPRMLSWIMRFPSKRVRSPGSSARSVGYASFMRMHVPAALLALLLQVPATARMTAQTTTPRTMRVDYFHTGKADAEWFSFDRVVLEPLPWPGNPRKPIDDTNLGKYLFEVIDRASNRVVYSRGFASVFGEWETTGEAKEMPPHVLRVAAVPGARGSGADLPEEAGRGERLSRGLDAARRSQRRLHRHGRSGLARCGDPDSEERRAGAEGRLPDPRRRLHGRGAREVREGRASPGGSSLRRRAVQEPPRGFQRLGHLPSGRAVGDFASLGGHPSPLADRRHVRRVRQRALHPDLRQPVVPRRGLVRSVRVRRDPDELPNLWRRRDLRPVRHRGGGQPLGAVRLRPRVRAPLRRARRRVLHLARVLRAGAPARAPSRGKRTSRRCWIRRTSSGRTS